MYRLQSPHTMVCHGGPLLRAGRSQAECHGGSAEKRSEFEISPRRT